MYSGEKNPQLNRIDCYKMEVVNRIICRTSSSPLLANYCRHWNSTVACTLFTREGDDGWSVTSTGEKRPKDDRIFNAIGATDELSSYIGLAREFAKDGEHTYTDKLKRIQCILVDISASILKSCQPEQQVQLSSRHTKDLEEWIEEYSRQLPPLEKYVIPGGGKACTSLHVARTICRRAERCVVPLVRNGEVDKEAQVYLNSNIHHITRCIQ
ncbi:corrinoid adenosyltransferase MMAB-like isoform X2 [Periplaneta americana]|uniref:corrinoid adenosyltransferase MMAB-like isoform X2 n=1 Tax=Periplaneta americana TaxID=6978 RepID=UPI0037E9A988